MDRKCETDTEIPIKTVPNNNQKCHRKRTRTRKRKVKLNEMKGLESLEITQKVRVKKQRIQCIINVNNVGENDQKDNETRKICSHKKSTKYKTDDKIKSTDKYKTDSRSFDKRKNDKLKTDFSSSFAKSKRNEKYKISSFAKSMYSDKKHNKSLHSLGTVNDLLMSEKRIIPMCMRDACRPAVPVKTCNCQLRRDKRKLKKIRKREAKANGRDIISLSPISSPSLGDGECEISYDNISSDGFTSHDDYDVGNQIDRLIKRTKDRDNRKQHRTIEDSRLRPISSSTPKRAATTTTSLNVNVPKQGITDSDISLELKESAVETICIEDSGDEDSSEICRSHSTHSIHSQATLVLEPTPSSFELEHTEKELGFENDNLYSPTDPTGNHTYSPSISPKNNSYKENDFHNVIPSYTPCLDVGKTSYSPTLSPEDKKVIFHTVDKRIEDFNYSVPQLSNQSETFSKVIRDPRILSINPKYNEPSIMPTFEENKHVDSECFHFQNAVNKVNNDIHQYYYDCNTNMIGQFYPAGNNENLFHPINTNQGIGISSSTMPDQSHADIQSYAYYYYQGMYSQSQLQQMQPEMGQMSSDNSGLPTQNNNAYYQKDKEKYK